MHSETSDSLDAAEAIEKVLFARGVLEILRGTGLFNGLIDEAMSGLGEVEAFLSV